MRLWRCFSSRRRAKTQAADSTPQTAQLPPRLLHPRPHINRVQVNAPLEGLPAEVRRHLLSLLQLQELAALVRASPVFHEQYALDRRYLLTWSLDASLGPLTAEAHAVSRSCHLGFAEHLSKPDTGLFFQQYLDNRFNPSHSLIDAGLSDEEVVQAASFYNIAHKVMSDYAKWALTNLGRQTGDGVTAGALTLSLTEKYRLMRSVYRFQLFCNVFGLGPHRAMRPIEERLYGIDIHRHFIVLFEPWEVEEIVCIYFYVKEKYDEIFTKIERDVHADNPRFDNQRRPPTPDGAFDLDTSGCPPHLCVLVIPLCL